MFRRVLFGNNHLFRFNDPIEEQKKPASDHQVIDWVFAQKELAMAAGQGSLMMDADREKQTAELKKKMEELEEKLKKDREEARIQIEAHQAALDEQNKKLSALAGKEREEAQRQLDAERAALKQQQDALEAKLRIQSAESEAAKIEEERRLRERDNLHDRIISLLPMITETNGICDELDRSIKFDLKIVPKVTFMGQMKGSRRLSMDNALLAHHASHPERVVAVRLTDKSSNRERLWPQDKFLDRIYAIRDFYHSTVMLDDDAGTMEDPFTDEAVVTLVGHAHVYLDSLYYLIDIDLSTSVIDYKGKVEGELSLKMWITDDRGIPFYSEDGVSPLDSVDQLQGRAAKIHLEVEGGKGFPPHLSGFRVDFKFYGNPEVFKSETVRQKTTNPQFRILHSFPIVLDEEARDFLLMDALTLQAWGEDAGGWSCGKGGAPGGKAGKKQLEEEKKQLEIKQQRLQELEDALLAKPATSRPRSSGALKSALVIEEDDGDEEEDMMPHNTAKATGAGGGAPASREEAWEEAKRARGEAEAAKQEIEKLKALLAAKG